MVSVNNHSQSDLKKLYNSTNINWAPVEMQLQKWSNLPYMGKKFRVIISFNYKRDNDSPTLTSRKGDKRGVSSATTRMLAEHDAQIDTEEESSRRPSIWILVYNCMQCDACSCHLQFSWCWEDSRDKKHYKLKTSHLTKLIDYVDGGSILEGHDDVLTISVETRI